MDLAFLINGLVQIRDTDKLELDNILNLINANNFKFYLITSRSKFSKSYSTLVNLDEVLKNQGVVSTLYDLEDETSFESILAKIAKSGVYALLISQLGLDINRETLNGLLDYLKTDERVFSASPYILNSASLSPHTVTDFHNMKATLNSILAFQALPFLDPRCSLVKANLLKLIKETKQGTSLEEYLIRISLDLNRLGFVNLACTNVVAYAVNGQEIPTYLTFVKQIEETYPDLQEDYFELKTSIESYKNSYETSFTKIRDTFVFSIRKPSLLIDLELLRPHFNGTYELVSQFINAMIRLKAFSNFSVTILGHEDTINFHGLDKLLELYPVKTRDCLQNETFVARLAFTQPFDWKELFDKLPLSAINILYFHDNIATDCNYLALENNYLKELWQFSAQNTTSFIFISEYVRKIFYNRFNRPYKENDVVITHSLNASDYRFKETQLENNWPGLKHFSLIIGNHYFHKQVTPVTKALAQAYPDKFFVSIGYTGPDFRNVKSFKAGLLSETEIAYLYNKADIIVFPSTYEGFGFPLLRAISQGIPVMIYKSEIYEEILDRLSYEKELVTYFQDINELLKKYKMISPNEERAPRDFKTSWGFEEVVKSAQAHIESLLANHQLLLISKNALFNKALFEAYNNALPPDISLRIESRKFDRTNLKELLKNNIPIALRPLAKKLYELAKRLQRQQ